MDSLKPHLQLAETLGLLSSQVSGGQIQKIEVSEKNSNYTKILKKMSSFRIYHF